MPPLPPPAKPPIETDRPDFTEAATVVARSRLQIESGFTLRPGRGEHAASGPEALFRYGLGRRSELRFALPDWQGALGGSSVGSGLGDFYFGAKVEIGSAGGFDFAVIPAVVAGSRRLLRRTSATSSDAADPELKIVYARGIGAGWTLSGMTYAAVARAEALPARLGLVETLSLGAPLGPSARAFLEYAGSYVRSGAPEHVIHFGATLLSGPDRQYDVRFGFDIGATGPRPFLGAGYSQRF